MKMISKNLKAYFLLSIFLIGIFETSFCKKRTLKNRSKSKREKNETIDYIINSIQKFDNENLLYFIMGALSIFIPEFDNIYQNKDKVKTKLLPCIDEVIGEFKKLVNIKTVSDDFKPQDSQILEKMKSKETCEKDKGKFDVVYETVEKLKVNNLATAAEKVIGHAAVSTDEYCNKIKQLSQKAQEKVLKDYECSMEFYLEECTFYKNLDCNKMGRSTGIIEFIEKVYKFSDFIEKAKICILDILKKDDSNSVATETLTSIISGGLGLAANILTSGAWGGIKASFYLIQITTSLNEDWTKAQSDLSFKIGKLIGKALMIGKDILLEKLKSKPKRYNEK